MGLAAHPNINTKPDIEMSTPEYEHAVEIVWAGGRWDGLTIFLEDSEFQHILDKDRGFFHYHDERLGGNNYFCLRETRNGYVADHILSESELATTLAKYESLPEPPCKD